MKTTSTPTLRFSGYPLHPIKTDSEKNLPLSVVKENNKSGKERSISKADVPENWDESWFANYE